MPFLLIKNLSNKNKMNKIKEKLLIAKIFLIISGILMIIYVENSSNYCCLKEEFSKMKGIKLYTIFKIVEYLLSLLNKYGYDLDFQLIKIIKEKKIKHKFFSFLILNIFIFIHLYSLNIFYFCTWLILNDIDKSFYLIYLKVNFIEFKQANKAFKSLHNFIKNDIYDRFLNYFILIFIGINFINKGKIKFDLSNIYLKRICLYFISELICDYLKGIIIFKINNINPKNIKLFLKEEIKFYQELDIDKNENKDNIYTFLKETKFYKNYIELNYKENLACSLLNINIYPFVIIFLNQIFFKHKFFSLYTFFKILILIIIKYMLEILIKGFNSALNNFSEKENHFILSNDSEKIKQN